MFKLQIEKVTASQSVSDTAQHLGALEVIDTYEEQLLELFLIRNPQFRFNKNYQAEFEKFKIGQLEEKPIEQAGDWFFFPWSRTLIHILPERDYFELRTARNKNLITEQEQSKFYNSVIALAGMSVGSHAALTIAMTGGAKTIKLADFDTISVSNLNRLRYGTAVLGKKKALTVGQMVAEINPYAEIYIYDDGVTPENLESFLTGDNNIPKSELLVEGVDNLEMKIVLREKAKALHVPVIMATDNGDGIIVDVERFDLNPEQQIFNGALGNFTLEDFKNFPPQELPKLATKVAGPNFIVPRMLSSLLEVGRTLYSWPQLGTAATFTGVASAFLARNILTGKPINSGKYDINLEKIFDSYYDEGKISEERKKYLFHMGL